MNTVDINTLEVTATDMNLGRTETPENKGENILTMRIIVIKAGRVVMVAIRGMPYGRDELGLDE